LSGFIVRIGKDDHAPKIDHLQDAASYNEAKADILHKRACERMLLQQKRDKQRLKYDERRLHFQGPNREAYDREVLRTMAAQHASLLRVGLGSPDEQVKGLLARHEQMKVQREALKQANLDLNPALMLPEPKRFHWFGMTRLGRWLDRVDMQRQERRRKRSDERNSRAA
jgi:hypothetical protein